MKSMELFCAIAERRVVSGTKFEEKRDRLELGWANNSIVSGTLFRGLIQEGKSIRFKR